MAQEIKTVAHSRAEHVQIVYDAHINGSGRLFGGRLMEWIDTIGAVVARRHSGSNVTTACVDHLHFHAAVPLDSIVVLIGEITYAGRTSMEVRVDTYVESMDMQRQLVNRAYLVYVAIDGAGKPVAVPKLELTTDGERAEYAAALVRRDRRKT